MNNEDIFQRVASGQISAAEALAQVHSADAQPVRATPEVTDVPEVSASTREVTSFAMTYFLRKIASALSVDEQDIDPEAQLMDLGLESSSLLKMSEELETELKITLYPTVFFEHTTLPAIVDHFVTEHRSAFERLMGVETPLTAPVSSPASINEVMRSTEQGVQQPKMPTASVSKNDIVAFAHEYFTAKIARALSVHVNDIDPEAQLMDLGLESSNLLTMAEELEAELKITLYPTVFFEHTTLPAIAAFFASEHAGAFLHLMGVQAKPTAPVDDPKTGPSSPVPLADPSVVTATEPCNARAAAALDQVCTLVAESMSVSTSDIDPDAELTDLGLDSGILMDLSNKLEAASSNAINPAIFFEHRTLRSLVTALVENGFDVGRVGLSASPGDVRKDGADLSGTALFNFEDRPFATPKVNDVGAPIWLIPGNIEAPNLGTHAALGTDDFDSLVKGLGKATPDAIFYVLDVRSVLRTDLLAAISEALSNLSMIVSNLGSQATTKLVVTVIGATGHGEAVAMAMSAYLKTVCHEYAKLKVVQLDILDEEISSSELWSTIPRACAAYKVTFAHYLIKNSEWAVRFAVPARTSRTRATLRKQGVFLITGGAGALGQLFARHLAQLAQARVILTGRRTNVELPETLCRDVEAAGGEVHYEACDVTEYDSVQGVIARTLSRYGQLDGIIHAAGVIDDAPIIRKTDEARNAVLEPKVSGVLHLDELTNTIPLDFFVCFSSIAGFTGNKGQSDYAAANGFLDGFMKTRSALQREGMRSGKSVSINWPLWSEGGMQPHQAVRELMEKHLGLMSLPSASGLTAFELILNSGLPQVAVFSGKVGQIETWIKASNPKDDAEPMHLPEPQITKGNLESLRTTSTKVLSQGNILTTIPALETPTKQSGQVQALTGPLAIVGADGIFPRSSDLGAYWENLISERDMISTQPERWTFDRYHETMNESFRENVVNIEAGYIDDVVSFDHAFFKISKAEADLMDPQQRLALQVAWRAVENAGYDPKSLQGQRIGVFVASSTRDFQTRVVRLAALSDQELKLSAHAATGMAANNIANRISYALDLTGPSELVDTACSSSLVALNRAADAIRLGQCDAAIVLGVNAILESMTFAAFSATGLLSHANRCMTFAKDAAGYVRSEGVGAVYVKPQDKADVDKDNILALIRSVKVNHGGRVQSLTAPNPRQQAAVIRDAIIEANVAPSSISYVEAHGTGTALGDSVEVLGLKSGFKQAQLALSGSEELQAGTTRIGSVKSNIGHLEAAAGMAGLLKLVLCLQHKKLPKTLHCDEENPFLDLEGSPFLVNHDTVDWHRSKDEQGNEIPLRAGLSSFGFGGTNGHLIIEEAPQRVLDSESTNAQPMCFPISAQDGVRLGHSVNELHASLEQLQRNGLAPAPNDVAFTLQVRSVMAARVCFVADSLSSLFKQLAAFGNDNSRLTAVNGEKTPNNPLWKSFNKGAIEVLTKHYVDNNDLPGLTRLWEQGFPVDWGQVPLSPDARRISLPGAEFIKTPCWPFAIGDIVTAPTISVPQTSPKPDVESSSQRSDSGSVENFILSHVAEALGSDVGAIDVNADLSGYGFDSILAMRLLDDLKTSFKIPLFITELRDKRTISQLSDYVRRELGDSAKVVPKETSLSSFSDPVFVLSAPRSGSTLLRAMLMGHPDLFAPPELHLLTFETMKQRQKALGTSGLGDGLIEAIAHLRAISAEAAAKEVADLEAKGTPIAEVFKLLQSLCAPRILVDKSPSYGSDSAALKRALEMFPNARFLHLLRRPEAMMSSFVANRFHRLLGAENADAWTVADKVWVATNENISAHTAALPKEAALTVHYEELVQRPALIAGKISEWLDIPRSKAMTTPYAKDRMSVGLKQGSVSVGDPNFLDHTDIDPREATEWIEAAANMPNSLDSVKLGTKFGYDIGPSIRTVNQAKTPASWTLMMAFKVTGLGNVQQQAFSDAFDKLLRLKPILATRYDQKTQMLTAEKTKSPLLEVSSAADLKKKERENAIQSWAQGTSKVIGKPNKPVFAAHLQHNGANSTLALLLNHHVCDGVSGQVLVGDLLELLEGRMPLPDIPRASYTSLVAKVSDCPQKPFLGTSWSLKGRSNTKIRVLKSEHHDLTNDLPEKFLNSAGLVDGLGAGLLKALCAVTQSEGAGLLLRHHGRLGGEATAIGNFAFDLPIYADADILSAEAFGALRQSILGDAEKSRGSFSGESLSNVRLNFQDLLTTKAGKAQAVLASAAEMTGSMIRTADGSPLLDLIVRRSESKIALIQRYETGSFSKSTLEELRKSWMKHTAAYLKTPQSRRKQND